MQIPMILLGVAFLGVLIWCFILSHQIDNLVEVLADLALHCKEREDWENGTFEKHAKRLDEAQKTASYVDLDIKNILEKETAQEQSLGAVNEEIRKLAARVKDFEDLSADSIQAQIDADRAWAAGVRAIAGYGKDFPTIDTRGLGNE